MGTASENRKRRWRKRHLIEVAVAVVAVVIVAVAGADNLITQDLVTDGNATATRLGGGNAEVYVAQTGGSCDANGDQINVTSDQSWLTIASPGYVNVTGCGTANAQSLAYSVTTAAPLAGVATVTGSEAVDDSQIGTGPNSDFTVTIVPRAPASITATAATSPSLRVNLSWPKSADETASNFTYEVEKKAGAGAYGALTTMTADASATYNYADTSVVSGTTYCYKVRARYNAGANTNVASAFTSEQCATPTAAPADAAPEVSSTVPADGATGVARNSTITVNFSEAVNVTSSWYTLVCDGVAKASTYAGGPSVFTITPTTDFAKGASCTLTVLADQVSDQDSNDPPNNMVINFEAGFDVVANVPPTAEANGPYTGNEGAEITLSSSGSSDSDGTITGYSWSVVPATSGLNQPDAGAACSFVSPTTSASQSPKVTCTDDGVYDVTLTVTDSDSATDDDTATLTVSNVAPVVTLASGNTYTYNESSSDRTFSYSVSDAGSNDTYTITSVSCGTAPASVSSNNSNTLTGSNGTLTCVFPDGPQTPQISVQATDDDGAASTAATHNVTVNNVKPTVAIDSLTGNSGTACIAGNTVTLGFSWTDPAGTNDTYSYTVDWDHGTDSTGSSATSPVSGLTHTYPAGGPYTIVVTVNDEDADDGGTASSTAFSFLYDTSGILQPVNNTQAHNDPSIFKYGSTIPVKIRVTDCAGLVVPGLTPQIAVKKINGSTPATGDDETITSTSGADTGTTMRYSDGLYIYNLATKSLADTSATYEIRITGPFTTVTTLFGTKPK